jgi:hypothetical protein
VKRPDKWGLGLFAVLLGLAAWRAACVLAGPDVDTDAYAHHMIARAILADPHDLAVHWVWLPLFHYAQVPLILLGGTMNTVRWANVILSAAVPFVLFRYVRKTTTPGRTATPSALIAFVAALVAGACPIVMQMGTTAQPEPLFALLLLGVAIMVQEQRYAVTAVLLGAAVMLRYEAWACFAVVAPWLFFEQISAFQRSRSGPAKPAFDRQKAWSALCVVTLPVALIGAWAILRRPVDGRWFGFLGQTRQFANDATHETGAWDRGLGGFVASAVYYPVVVPARVFGPVMLLVPFGIARTVRDQGARFVASFAACLGFISFSWITRSSLGLDRHFVVVVPLYATFAAQGAATLADGTARLVERLGRNGTGPLVERLGRDGATVGRGVAAGLTLLVLAGLAVELDVWMGYWRSDIERGWPDRAALGAYLRSVPPASTIFCDDATLEILSELDRRRFDRHWLDDPHTWDLVTRAAQADGVAYVATWSRKLAGHEPVGPVVFRAGQQANDPATGVAVMRVGEGPGRATR